MLGDGLRDTLDPALRQAGVRAHGRRCRRSRPRLKGLTVALPRGSDRAHAIENITFSVGAGEIVCVVGESGSGKSVTAQAVMGLLPRELRQARGQARLQGEDVLAATPSRLRDLRGTRMAMIFQEPMTALNPVMKVGDQIAEVLEIHTKLSEPDRRKRALQIMRAVHLPEPERLIDVYPHQISGGQRQRIMIAAALVLDPGAADRRRADHGARRDHAGADPAADARAAGAARHRRAVHHPRLRRGGRDRPSRGRHAVGPRGRDGHARRHPAAPAVRLHAHADRLGAEPEAARRAPKVGATALAMEKLSKTYGAKGSCSGRAASCGRPRTSTSRCGAARRSASSAKSGSGKSTVARCVARLIEPTSGAIRIGDVDVAHLPEEPPARPSPARADRVPGPLPLAQSAPHGAAPRSSKDRSTSACRRPTP